MSIVKSTGLVRILMIVVLVVENDTGFRRLGAEFLKTVRGMIPEPLIDIVLKKNVLNHADDAFPVIDAFILGLSQDEVGDFYDLGNLNGLAMASHESLLNSTLTLIADFLALSIGQ